MQVNPGELDKKIKIIKVTDAKNSNGFSSLSKEVFKKPWASVSQKSANESFKANSELATSQKRFLIRYIPGITYDMIIEYNAQEYDIKYIHDYEDKHEYVEIIAELRDTNGRIGT